MLPEPPKACSEQIDCFWIEEAEIDPVCGIRAHLLIGHCCRYRISHFRAAMA